jgi:glycosyltransferase involved in cell wall biosynthesis
MKINKKISIAMATYNGEKYIKTQLESFLTQDSLPTELVVCDDCSSDETVKILIAFKDRAPFEVRIYINEKNIGYERNFEKAISYCNGDIIFLSDQDDSWKRNKIAEVEKIFKKNEKILLVINDMDITDKELNKNGHTVINQLKTSGILGENYRGFVIGCGTAFRRELNKLIMPFPKLNFGHDRWIHSVAHSINSRYILNISLQLHRRHGENASIWLHDEIIKPSWKDLNTKTIGLDMIPIYENQRAVHKEIENRLITIEDDKFFDSNYLINKAILKEKKHQIALSNRIELLNSQGMKRKFLSIQMLLKGEYKYFLGLKSFIKDLIR